MSHDSGSRTVEALSSDPSFLAGGGEMGRLIGAKDWSTTPLGPISTWPQGLKIIIQVMLTSRYAMWLAWGGSLTFFCNDAYRPTLGVKQTWALGSPAEVVWAEIWPDIGPRIRQVMERGEATWDEGLLLFLGRSGYAEETYHTFSYSPVPGDSGSVSGMLCVVTEETDRIIGTRRLASLQALGSSLAGANAQDEVLATVSRCLADNQRDLPFTLTYLFEDGGTRARLACSSAIAVGGPAAPAVIEMSHPSTAWPTDRLARLEPAIVGDLDARFGNLPTGAWDKPPNEAVVVPIARSGQDRPAGFLVVAINPYRRLDAGYAGFIDLLAGQIAAGLANARAYEEERRRAEALAEIDRAKTTFFSNVSHEFRTPLTLMLGPLEEILAKPEKIEASRDLVAVAHRNGLRLLKLVNSLLDFARIEAGRMQARYQATDLAALTADLASNFRSATDRAGLHLAVACPPLPHPVHVDRDMWEKVVLNLLSNAFKFTFDGEIGVEVMPSADGTAAELVVRDTGTGIPLEELPHLFERFHRVEGAKGRTIEGSGIGLALVQELVRLHGGSIRVDSTPGKGSRFVVSLPFGSAHLPAGQAEDGLETPTSSTRARAYVEEALRWLPEGESAASAAGLPSQSDAGDVGPRRAARGGGARVLLADDNPDMRDYARRLLTGDGYAVEAVADGEQALAAARRLPPDMIVSDVMMPRLDGKGLLAAIRADPALRHVPVLLLSARAGEEARVEGLESGADDYLTKPFSAVELLARVHSNMALARVRAETHRALAEDARVLETLNRVGTAVAAELDLSRAVQVVTDAATELTAAAFGAFFYNVIDQKGESYMLYTLSSVPREAFSKFPMPRNTGVFAPTFGGEGVVRSDDITKDPRYGKNDPHYGMPRGHLPVRSYLAVPVVSRSGEVLGGLFFGHPDPGIFTERAERLAVGIASQAAIAIDNARLYQAAQTEIAERRRTEAALRESEERQLRLNEALEAKVVERTAELKSANDQLIEEAAERERMEGVLRQAQKMEAIGQLTGGVAHDFNNLLTIIIGNLETLTRHLGGTGDVARLRRATENAHRGAQRAAALTQSLLAFSRRQPLDPKPVDVNRLVTGMSDLLRRTLGEHIAVETVLSGGLWRTHADQNQLESALINLAVNARDAMPGGGKLTIETANAHLDEGYATLQAEVVPGQYVVVAMTDTGAGMTREVIAKAFDPFFTTKDVGHGTGLGLSQVYGFVKQTGGHVKIYSEVGQGTTVKIYLPRLSATVDEVETVEPTGTLAGGDSSESILVVEDDEDVRAHTTDILNELGYRVFEAANARLSLDILDRERNISLLFTDVGLPGGMNGRWLADEARRRRPDLKVLFTTGYAKNAIVHDGRLDPGVQLITKPFTYNALASKLRDVLDGGDEGPPCVLVVEDEVLIRMVTVDTLETLGFKVEEAGSATEAVNKLKLGTRIDVALVDMGLPDRKGDVLVGELRELQPKLRIVIASGYSPANLKKRVTEDQLTRFLAKPYDGRQLEAMLKDLGIDPPVPTPP